MSDASVDPRLLLTLGSGKVDDVAVALEHVDLLNRLDGLDVELLQGALELLVVGAGALVDLLDLPARGTLASVQHSLAIPSYAEAESSKVVESTPWRLGWGGGRGCRSFFLPCSRHRISGAFIE